MGTWPCLDKEGKGDARREGRGSPGHQDQYLIFDS
jgi:hypothetical protein